MNSAYVQLELMDLVMGLGMVLIAIILAAVQKFGALKSLIWGICRAVAQLIGVGFILTAVFDIQHPGLLVFVLSVMMAVAAWTASSWIKHKLRLMVHPAGVIQAISTAMAV